MKHVDIQLNFIQEVINDSIIQLKYIATTEMLADFLTKAICRPAWHRTMNCLRFSRMEDRGNVKMVDLSHAGLRSHIDLETVYNGTSCYSTRETRISQKLLLISTNRTFSYVYSSYTTSINSGVFST
ncbi:hypothetical protein O181_047292 [Austropuccinia psidii MF-1]|uniref:Uncharacterized protein n=1 Tax=Austropuccinia psidii MF-1 TaxID=1389203 RepID=A0A9Q3DSX1_9BASI|nr:hypothetical protein [Austropuccinia psidii MF-1]